MKTVKRAAIYARYSLDMQSPMSIPDQIRLCQRFARQRGWEVVREYSDEQQTSASNWRPDYQAMIADLHNGGFDILLAESIDRVTRDLEDNAYLYKHTKHLGVTIHTLGEGEMDAMKMTFRGLMGALFLEDLKNKTRRGLIGHVHNGRSAGGRSYGYRPALTPDGERGALDIVEDEAAVIRRIFREFAAGVSPLKIAAGLNRDGIPSPRPSRSVDLQVTGNRIQSMAIAAAGPGSLTTISMLVAVSGTASVTVSTRSHGSGYRGSSPKTNGNVRTSRPCASSTKICGRP